MRRFKMCGYQDVNLVSGNKPGRELDYIEFEADGYSKESVVKEKFTEEDRKKLFEKGFDLENDVRFKETEIKFENANRNFQRIIKRCQFKLKELIDGEWTLIESGCQH